MTSKEKQFKNLLKDIFQFNKNRIELNFGVYRVFKKKEADIKRFIDEKLSLVVEESLSRALSKYEIESLNVETIKENVFDHILNFFKRFYEKGDFYPRPVFSRREEKKAPYCLDYYGEEIFFWWPTKGHYYIKTDKLLADYLIELGGKSVVLKVSEVDAIKGNEKDKRKFYLKGDIYESEGNLIVELAYIKEAREGYEEFDANNFYELLKNHVENLSKEDVDFHVKKFKNLKSSDFFIHPKLKLFLTRELQYYLKNEIVDLDNPVSLVEARITQEVAQAIIDFLANIEELQQLLWEKKKFAYNVNYVLTLDRFKNLDLVKEIEEHQNFPEQLKEWTDELQLLEKVPPLYETLKKWKEVSKIDVDKEWLTNKQRERWEELFGEEQKVKVSKIFLKDPNYLLKIADKVSKALKGLPLFGGNSPINLKDILETYLKIKHLPIDTRYFPELKYKILEQFDNLEEELDGVLIKSDNWQALNTILLKYKEKVQTIYIDPPFNTGEDFLYKDNYQDATWLTLMESRLKLAKELLNEKGSLFLHLDENANYYGRLLLTPMFATLKEIVWNTNATGSDDTGLFSYKSFGDKFIRQHDVIYHCSLTDDFKFYKLWTPSRENRENLSLGWLDLLSEPIKSNPKKLNDYIFFVEEYENGRFLKKEVLLDGIKVYPVGDIWNDIYSFMQSEVRVSESLGFQTQKPENLLRRIIQSTSQKGELVLDFFLGSGTTIAVAHKLKRKWIGVEMGEIFGNTWLDEIEIDKDKYEEFKKKVIRIVKDGKRKYRVLVRKLGILGRMKIVLFGDKEFGPLYANRKRRPHLTSDINWQGGGFFKYLYLEQYEDTLENVDFKNDYLEERTQELERVKELYPDFARKETLNLLKHFVIDNTKTLLMDIVNLKNPFKYNIKLAEGKEESVDFIETFNLLKPVYVKKIFEREFEGKKYIFVDGDSIGIVWREAPEEYDQEFAKKEEEFIKQNLPDYRKKREIFVNSILGYPKSFLDSKAKEILTEFRKILLKGVNIHEED